MTLSEDDILLLLNRIFDIRKKVRDTTSERSVERNLSRMAAIFQDKGYKIYDPLGEDYDETRIDCEAKIAGESSEELYISEVIKPIIYLSENDKNFIIQKGIVIAETK